MDGFIERVLVGGGKMVFMDFRDGTSHNMLSVFLSERITESYNKICDKLFDGTSVNLCGAIVKGPPKCTQLFEMHVTKVTIHGVVNDPTTYPIQKSNEHDIVFHRRHPHIRVRLPVTSTIFRIRQTHAIISIYCFSMTHKIDYIIVWYSVI